MVTSDTVYKHRQSNILRRKITIGVTREELASRLRGVKLITTKKKDAVLISPVLVGH